MVGTDDNSPDEEREDRLDELFDCWEKLFKQGRDVPAAELCHDDPELTNELARRIAASKALIWVNADSQTNNQRPAELGGSNRDSSASGVEDPTRTYQMIGGRYRLDRRIAEGGSAEVWRGFDLELQRPVAVKVPRPGRLFPSDRGEWFLAEARRAANLRRHPNIVPVYDVARDHGLYYIVSELIEGNDLGRHLVSGSFPTREAVFLAAEVAEALEHAHQQGIVHRDVKPANILLDQQRKAFVTDFGIAASAEDLRQGCDDGRGTLPYMAPEQLFDDSNRISSRTDVYALGVVLYELLTGKRPYNGNTPALLREQILLEEPRPPRALNPNLAREADRICLRCLAKSPVNRYPTARELANDLRQLHARLSVSRWRKGLVTATAVFTVGLAFYSAAPLFSRAPAALVKHPTAMDEEESIAMEKILEGDDQSALEHTDVALSYYRTVRLLAVRARLLARLKRDDEAEACCDEVLRLAPGLVSILKLKAALEARKNPPLK